MVDTNNLSEEAREHLYGRVQESGDGGWWPQKKGSFRLPGVPGHW